MRCVRPGIYYPRRVRPPSGRRLHAAAGRHLPRPGGRRPAPECGRQAALPRRCPFPRLARENAGRKGRRPYLSYPRSPGSRRSALRAATGRNPLVKRNPFGIETKTAASAGIGGLVTLVLLLNTWQHWLAPPPPDATAAIEAFAVGVAGDFAKHTPRPPAPPPVLPAA